MTKSQYESRQAILSALWDDLNKDRSIPKDRFEVMDRALNTVLGELCELVAPTADDDHDDARRADYADFQKIANRGGGFRVDFGKGPVVEFSRSPDYSF
jgi:hypothetical protein